MKISTGFWIDRMVLGMLVLVGSWLCLFPELLNGQNTCTNSSATNAVYALCNNGNLATTSSPAFIDASVFGAQNTNICKVLNGILSSASYPAAGAIVDARGLPGNTGTSMTCTASPWAGITLPRPSTILLPAGTIVIPSTWGLPPSTRLIGEGDNIGSGTILQAKANSFPVGTAMIQFGLSSLCTSACTGISVENLNLDGQVQNQAINGIVNAISQDLSYVDHVSLYRILGAGLSLSGNANNSGPYSNVTFDTGGSAGLSSTVCAQINGLSGTRGIHGLSCISESNDANAAVLLDSSNNSLEDVRIVGFYDGIRVGANANAQSNVLINIIGDTALRGERLAAAQFHLVGWATI